MRYKVKAVSKFDKYQPLLEFTTDTLAPILDIISGHYSGDKMNIKIEDRKRHKTHTHRVQADSSGMRKLIERYTDGQNQN